jgi:osmoprotectant transport system substrate-binding protein
LERTYGLHVRQFIALDTEPQRVTALDEGVANVALMFSTDAELASGDLFFLADDRGLQPSDNVVPIVRDAALARVGDRLVRILDNVSARLSTRELIFLNWRMAVAGRSAQAEAHGWLVREGLVPRRG